MGEIRVKVSFRNELDVSLNACGKLPKNRVRAIDAEAVVDTGAALLLLPQELVASLGLRIVSRMTVILADDRKAEMELAGPIEVTILGRSMMTDCLVGPLGCELLIGQVVLERLDLICDPLKQTLTPRPESPFRPTLKMKPFDVESRIAGAV